MTPERYTEFIERIMDESQVIDNYYLENPEFAHRTRLSDALSTFVNIQFCHAQQPHWPCLVATTAVARQIYALSVIRPMILEEIYTDFKADFQATIPEDTMFYKAIECHEYPVPKELLGGSEDHGH